MAGKLTHAIGRRGLLGMFAAAPVIARSAAEKAGIEVFGHGPLNSGVLVSHGGPQQTINDYLKGCVNRLMTGEIEAEIRSSLSVRRLDPDIASMRSISLSAAVQMQKQRDVQRELEQHKRQLAARLSAELGVNWKSISGWITP